MIRLQRVFGGVETRCAVLGLVVLILAGCASTVHYSSPDATPLVGGTIQLKQELSARAGARIYIQYGRVMGWTELTVLEPYCQFYVLRTAQELRQPLVIKPDTFVIERVFRKIDLTAVEGLQLALGAIWYLHDLSQRTMSTYIELSSDAQPNVLRLICSRWADPVYWNHVSIEEIIDTLGEIAELKS